MRFPNGRPVGDDDVDRRQVKEQKCKDSVGRASYVSFLSPYVELLRVASFRAGKTSQNTQPPPAMVALARVFTSSHSEQSR